MYDQYDSTDNWKNAKRGDLAGEDISLRGKGSWHESWWEEGTAITIADRQDDGRQAFIPDITYSD
jgi:hypothetical protein